MTAIVGILNKQAVAVAADSAVTIGGGTKIYNTANKIFNLSKKCPVGIAIYGNAALNGCVPWEVVIKMYRNHIGSKVFPTLREYADHFFTFVKDYTGRYISDDDAHNMISGNVLMFWSETFTKGLCESDSIDAPIAQLALPVLHKKLEQFEKRMRKARLVDEYKSVTLDQFVEETKDIIELIKKQITTNGGRWNDFEQLVQNALFKAFTTDAIKNPFISGIALFGYGDDEIYPSQLEFQVYNKLLAVQRIKHVASGVICETNSAYVCPMAQKDVIETFIEGVSHKIKNTFLDATATSINEVVKSIANIVRKTDPDLAEMVAKSSDYDTINEQFRKTIDGIIRKESVDPLIRTIATMGKEDIADLAENLIYMTSMKRHVTPYAESVGGPIDVAVISKGDGFIWIKRKHYFDAGLNRSFFDNNK